MAPKSNTKSRVFSHEIKYGTRTEEGKPPEDLGSSLYTGQQVTVSEGHRRGRNGHYGEGGPFFTYRIEPSIKTRHFSMDYLSGGRKHHWSGPAHVSLVPNNMGGHAAPSNAEKDVKYLDPIGAEAIALVDPGNPSAQTGVALGEILRDRRLPIPAIQAWKRRTELAQAAAGEYLNAVFGWLPLLNDMKNTAQSVKDGNLILENYKNASGTFVHREFQFPNIESSSQTVIGSTIASYGFSSGNINDGVKEVVRDRKTVTKRWFSGAFTYKAADESSSFQRCLGINSDAEKLFGVSLTPDLVWELTPWSWAIDWFSNAQSVIHNASSFGLAGLVMRYGYIMEETSIVDTYTMPVMPIKGQTGSLPPCSVTYTVKRRREANPFGFGVSWEGLSPTQLAITAALGITRLR